MPKVRPAPLDDKIRVGMVFGDWTVVREGPPRIYHYSRRGGPLAEHRMRRFLCRCSCGAEHNVNSGALLNRQSSACRPCAYRKLRDKAPAKVRFERFVDRSAGPDGCHIWIGAKQRGGYGTFSIRPGDGSRRQQGAHVVAWQWETRLPLPPRMHICHRCDNPPCVNPKHLFLGTPQDNISDKVAKGRQAFGVDHPLSKYQHLTDEARRLRSAGTKIVAIARALSIPRTAVQTLLRLSSKSERLFHRVD